MRTVLILCACITLNACSAEEPEPEYGSDLFADTSLNAATLSDAAVNAAATEIVAAPRPSRNYDEKDGDSYLYVAAVSDEDLAKGKAAGDVVGFRYLGKLGRLHRLQNSGTGAINVCSEPCKIIKRYYPSGEVERVGFNASSIIGAAFEDAFHGFLEPEERSRPIAVERDVTYSDLAKRQAEPQTQERVEEVAPKPEIPNHVVADVDRL